MISLGMDGPCHVIITKSADDPCSQPRGLTLQKDVLANMADLNQGIPDASVSVLGGDAAVLDGHHKKHGRRGRPHLFQRGLGHFGSPVSISDFLGRMIIGVIAIDARGQVGLETRINNFVD